MIFTFAHEGHDHATEVVQTAQASSLDPAAVAGALCLLIAIGILAYAFIPRSSSKSTKTARAVAPKAKTKTKRPVKKTSKKK